MNDLTTSDSAHARTARRLPGIFSVAAIAAVLIALYGAAPFAVASLARAGLPFADNLWTEGPLLLQLHRMAIGEPAYASTLDTNSFIYGPVYLVTLQWIERVLSLPVDAVALRAISIVLTLLSMIPLALCALLIGRRAGTGGTQFVAQTAIVVVAVVFGVSVAARSLAFEAIHPNALLFLWVESALALYYAVAAGVLSRRATWPIALLCYLAAFTEQNSAPIFPMLMFGLVATRTIGLRAGTAAALAYVFAIVAGYFAMPGDARAWTLLVPRAQHYGLSIASIGGLVAHVRDWQLDLAALLVAALVAIALIGRRDGARSLPIDAAPFAAVLVTALAGYFRQSGAGSNLTLLALFAVPYYAALAGLLVPWTLETWQRRVAGGACALVVIAVSLTVYTPPRQIADARMVEQLRQAKKVANELCARHRDILVTVFPEMFFDCPTARYALYVSFGQLAGAYPRYYVGETTLDRQPTTPYVVSFDFYGMPLPPPAWLRAYHVVQKVPVPFGYASTFYWPATMLVYARDAQAADQRPPDDGPNEND